MLRDGVPIDLGVLKQRALLAMLLIHANRVVSTDQLIDELWAGDAGKDRQNALVGQHLTPEVDARARPRQT